MEMLIESLEIVSIDSVKTFKSLFFTNALNGTEDYLVSDKIYCLVGQKLVEFRTQLMAEQSPKNLEEMLKTITPPKGIKRKNTKGSELMDCDSDENENIDEDLEDEVENSEITEAFQTTDPIDEIPLPTKAPKLSKLCQSPEINKDAEFLDKLQLLIESHETSKLLTKHISKLRNMNQEARNSVRKRIQNFNSDLKDDVVEATTVANTQSDNLAATSDFEEKPGPKIGEFWTVKNGIHTLFSTIATENPTFSTIF